jgi:hypothetical protein
MLLLLLMNTETTAKIICRKCGGPHFTIKCGKEVIPVIEPIVTEPVIEPQITGPVTEPRKRFDLNRKQEHNTDTKYNNTDTKYNKHNKHEKYYSRVTYRVKLSELPRDMSEEELMELTSDWGHIVKLKVINYDENSVAYIDFGFEDESKYFIEAIDKTPFESLLLSATRVDSY